MSKTIINDIDVSECSYYCKENEPYGCEIWDNECEAQNCYYKQLQRLKHQYADVLKLAKENADSNEFCLQELEKEYEHLKKCCTQAGEELSKHSFKWDGKEKNLVIQAMELNERFEKYQKTLQEIKEIAKTGMHCEGMGCDFMPKILDLITKVEEENE